MKFKKSLILGISLISALFFTPVSARAEAVYRANSDKSESVSIPLPDEKVQKALLKNSDPGYYGALTQEECDSIIDHLVHILTSYNGDIFQEIAYKNNSAPYCYNHILRAIRSNTTIVKNQKLINAAFEYASRNINNFSRMLNALHDGFIELLDNQKTDKNSLEYTKQFLLSDYRNTLDIPYLIEWYMHTEPDKKKSKSIFMHYLKNSDLSNMSGQVIIDFITDYPEEKRNIERLLVGQRSLRYLDMSAVKNHSFFKSVMLERYLKGKKINRHHSSPIVQKVIALEAQEIVNALLPAYHEFKKGPTKKHIDHLVTTYPGEEDRNAYQKELGLSQLSQDIILLEDQEAQHGHYTFVNGAPKHVYPLQYWFTKLFEIKNNVDVGEYLFTRFETNHSIFKKGTDYIKRMWYLHKGSPSNVFLQHSLLNGSPGINPAKYYLQNGSCSGYKNTIENIFELFNYSLIFKQFKDELLDLEREFLDICPHGKVMLFSFSPKALKKCVYPCHYGHMQSVDIFVPKAKKTVTTQNIEIITYVINSDPQKVRSYDKKLEFCFIPTTDYGLNPSVAGKDIRIFTLTGADPEKMKTYKEKEQALFEKIKAAITGT